LVSLSSVTGAPCQTVQLTLSGDCWPDCGSMSFTLEAQYPEPYNALLPPWLTISTPSSISCVGGSQNGTVNVTILEHAPPGEVPIVVTATTSTGTQCQATGNVTVDRTYLPVEVRYKTFIGCKAIPLEFPVLGIPLKHFRGDARGFGYDLQPSRTYQSFSVSLNPTYPRGDIGPTTMLFSPSESYSNSNIDPCNNLPGIPCASYCNECVTDGAIPNCQEIAQNGSDGNNLAVTFDSRPNLSTIQMQLDLVGKNPCQTGAPAIDASMVFQFRQICQGNILGPIEWRMLSGAHDGFPWHELYISGYPVYVFDPCPAGPDPNTLFPPTEIDILNSTAFPGLGLWQVVPGQQ